MAEWVEELRRAGRNPLALPIGGSTGAGALGYVRAMRELAGQIGDGPVQVVAGIGSCGTFAGLNLGARLFLPRARIVGISVSRTARAIRGAHPGADRRQRSSCWRSTPDWPSPTWSASTRTSTSTASRPTRASTAIRAAAHLEGLLLDPVYTGKVMAGLLDLARRGFSTRPCRRSSSTPAACRSCSPSRVCSASRPSAPGSSGDAWSIEHASLARSPSPASSSAGLSRLAVGSRRDDAAVEPSRRCRRASPTRMPAVRERRRGDRPRPDRTRRHGTRSTPWSRRSPTRTSTSPGRRGVALGRIGSGAPCRRWSGRSADPNENVRWSAAIALGRLGPAARDAVAPLTRAPGRRQRERPLVRGDRPRRHRPGRRSLPSRRSPRRSTTGTRTVRRGARARTRGRSLPGPQRSRSTRGALSPRSTVSRRR